MVSGSQKALGLPPGLAFLAASEKAWKLNETADLPRFYFDLKRERDNQRKNQTAWTPAISLVEGLDESLQMFREEGLQACFARHERLARGARAGMQALGLELYSKAPSAAMTTVLAPQGTDSEKLVKHLFKQYGIKLVGGQEAAKGKIFRIAHLGYFDDFDALAVRSATKVTKEVLDSAQKLRVIGRAGTGVDNIDLGAASRRGVVVMNAPGGNSVSVAEHTVALLLALARQIADASQSTRGGKWEKKKFAAGRELLGKTLGVVGTGNIGALVVQRAKAFGIKVIAYDPFLSEEAAAKLGVELVPLADIFRRSDAVTLHVPLNEQTKNMVAAPQLAQMKPGALLINCARGGLVDEMAVAEALESKRLGGAALDVFETEPPPAGHPLFSCENFIATPHLGGSTEDAQQNVA